MSPSTMRFCETFDEEVINLLSKMADFQVIRPEAMGEEFVEELEAVKDPAEDALHWSCPR